MNKENLQLRILINMKELKEMLDNSEIEGIYGNASSDFKRIALQLRKDLIKFEKIIRRY